MEGGGGTRDISRNETDSAVRQIKMFVQTHKNTNVIVMEAPFRYDLDAISCVNNEVKTFNRKHRKHLKIYSNASVIRIDSNREFYTKYGLHMNQKGKEQTAKMIGLEIKLRLKEKGGTPIILTDKSPISYRRWRAMEEWGKIHKPGASGYTRKEEGRIQRGG